MGSVSSKEAVPVGYTRFRAEFAWAGAVLNLEKIEQATSPTALKAGGFVLLRKQPFLPRRQERVGAERTAHAADTAPVCESDRPYDEGKK